MALIGSCDPVSWQLFLNKSPSLVDNCQAPQVKSVKGFWDGGGAQGDGVGLRGLMVHSYDLFPLSVRTYSVPLLLVDLD